MPDFRIVSAAAGGTVVVTLTGNFDLRGRDELGSALLAAVDAAPQVLVDLAAVEFLDSSGLHALVSAYQTARGRGRHLYATNATGSVATILEITGVIELLRPPDADPSGEHERPGRHG
jgi:anti-sigma B factor antagonist